MSKTAQMKAAIASKKTEPKPPKVTHKELPGGGPATIIQHATGTAGDNLPDVAPKKSKSKEPTIFRGTPHGRDKAHEKDRLPHGSVYHVEYDAKAVRWTGTLTIQREGDIPKVFSDYSSGVFRLLANLDRRYREWVEKKEAEFAAAVPKTDPE